MGKWCKPPGTTKTIVVIIACIFVAAIAFYVFFAFAAQSSAISFNSPITNIVFSQDDNKLAIAEMSGEIHVFDVATRSSICHIAQESNSINTVTFVRPDVLGIIIGHDQGDLKVQLWDFHAGTAKICFSRKLGEAVYLAVFSRDGSQLVTLSLETPCGTKSILSIIDVEKDKVVRSANIPSVPGLRGLSPDGKYFATVDTGGAITVWRLQDLTRMTQLDGGLGLKCLALASGGKSVALGYGDGIIRLIRTEAANINVSIQCACGEDVRVVSFSADASVLACGVAGPNVYLFDVQQQPTLLKTFTGRGFATHQVEFSHNDKLLAVGAWRGRIIDRKLLGTLKLIDISTELGE